MECVFYGTSDATIEVYPAVGGGLRVEDRGDGIFIYSWCYVKVFGASVDEGQLDVGTGVMVNVVVAPVVGGRRGVSFSRSKRLPYSRVCFVDRMFGPGFTGVFEFPVASAVTGAPCGSAPGLLVGAKVRVGMDDTIVVDYAGPLERLFVGIFLMAVVVSIGVSS